MHFLIQISVSFLKFQTQIFQWELLYKFIIILESWTWYFIQTFTVYSGNLYMIYIVGRNYCKLITKIISAKRMWIFQRKTSLLHKEGHFNRVQIVSFMICIFKTHCKDFFQIFHNVKILNRSFGFWEKLSLGTSSILRGSTHLFQIISPP